VRAGLRKNQESDFVAIVACNHDVLCDRRKRRDRPYAKRAYMDPRCTRKFEVLFQPARVFNAFRWIILVCESSRVAHFVEVVTLDPRTRNSHFPAASTGTIFNSYPGLGSPTTLVRKGSKWTIVTCGAVSVDPQAAVMRTRLPVSKMERRSRRS